MLLCRLLHSAKTETPIPEDLRINGFSSHLNEIKPGYAFVCIKGTKADGHTKAKEAENCGATVIIAEHMTDAKAFHIITDTRAALALMYKSYYENPDQSLVLTGVTGTNGKTTTVYFIHHILSVCGLKAGLIGTVENLVGKDSFPSRYTTPSPDKLYPLLKQMADSDVKHAVLEVSSHSLAQKRVEGLDFKTGVFTNLTQDHLDYHGTMEKYLKEKKKLFYRCEYAVLNADDPYFSEFASLPCKRLTYGINGQADFTAYDIFLNVSGTMFKLCYPKGQADVFLKAPGRFNIYNSLAAIAACRCLGINPCDAAKALLSAKGIPGRMEILTDKQDFTVILDYAHTPDGLQKVLETVNVFKKGRLVTVFGCGGDRDRTKRPIMGKTAAKLSDFLVITSDNPRTENPDCIIEDILAGVKRQQTPYIVINNRKKAIEYTIRTAQKNDIIILAGKGHEDYQIIGEDILPFDEKSIVKKALARYGKD